MNTMTSIGSASKIAKTAKTAKITPPFSNEYAITVDALPNPIPKGEPPVCSVIIKQRIEWIPIWKLQVDHYQREITAKCVKDIACSIHPAMLGLPIISIREDGTLVVADGQTRICAMREIGVTDVLCIIMEDLSPQDEARYFMCQKMNTRNLSIYDVFHAGVFAKDEHYVAMNYVLHKHGYHASRWSEPRGIVAIASLSKIVRIFSFHVLDQQLAWTAIAWPNDALSIQSTMLPGMAEFTNRFGNVISVQKFAERMSNKHPGDLIYEYRTRSAGRAHKGNAFKPNQRFIFCSVLVDAYNKGLPSGSKQRLKLDWDPQLTHLNEVD